MEFNKKTLEDAAQSAGFVLGKWSVEHPHAVKQWQHITVMLTMSLVGRKAVKKGLHPVVDHALPGVFTKKDVVNAYTATVFLAYAMASAARRGQHMVDKSVMLETRADAEREKHQKQQ